MEKIDILIAGSGIAGLFFAIKTTEKNPDLSVVIMTKSEAKNSNTYFAQGGIAVVTDLISDSFENHISDTLKSGGGLCDEKIVQMVVHQAPERIKEIIAIGAAFDKNTEGKWDLGLEGGHSNHRILHHKDISGKEIENKLLEKIRLLPNVTLLENHMLLDLTVENIQNNQQCTGAFYFDNNKNSVKYIRAKAILLSTGGSGQVFPHTTNPQIATGDGIAMAHRAGAIIEDMQFVQFHPTAFYEKDKNPFFLISEAVRGFGAHIVNGNAKRFAFKYDLRGELATRDIVSNAIAREMQESDTENVYLDCRHLDFKAFLNHFPSIVGYCRKAGIDPEIQLIPIVPVAHYQCGGIAVDSNGETNIKNLYAIGECAKTGLHGKNRLASNSLLEALVFAHQAAEHLQQQIDSIAFYPKIYVPKHPESANNSNPEVFKRLRKSLQNTMGSIYADKFRKDNTALSEFKKLKLEAANLIETENISMELIEITNLFAVASLIIEHHNNYILSHI